MPISDLKLFTQDSERVGENIARTIRIIAKLLMDWSDTHGGVGLEKTKHTKKNLECGKEPTQKQLFPPRKKPPPLDPITFDKLVVSFCRLWEMFFKQGEVRYKPAFLHRRGFHGPGRAMKINRSEDEELSLGKDPEDLRHGTWAFVTEIVEKLKPALSDTRILFRLEGKAWDPKCQIYPELDQSVWDSWLFDIDSQDRDSKFLTYRELKYVDSISSVLSKLNKKELRAIGTHCNPSETFKDIEFNLNACKRNFQELIDVLQGDSTKSDIGRAAYKMVTTSREILRKSSDNRKAYESAWNKSKQFITDTDVLSAFQETQNQANKIWDDNTILQIRENAQHLLDISLYCRCSLLSKGHIQHLKKKEIEESTIAYKKLKVFVAQKLCNLPSYDEIQNLTDFDLANTLNELMTIVLSSLPIVDRARLIGVP